MPPPRPQSPPPLPEVRRRRRRLRWVGVGGLVLLEVSAALLTVAFLLWRSRTREEVQTRVAAIRAQGLPVNWEDLRHWPAELPAAQNSAGLYTNALAQLHYEGRPGGAAVALPGRGDAIAPELRRFMLGALKTNRVALELAARAATSGPARYPLDYSAGPAVATPHLDALLGLGELLSFQVLLSADAGHASEAGQALETALAAACSLDLEPLLGSQITAQHSLNRACRSLERVLGRTALSEATLQRLAVRLTAAETTNRMVLAVLGERAQGMDFLRLAQEDYVALFDLLKRNLPEEEDAPVPPAAFKGLMRQARMFDRDRIFFMRAAETNLALAATPAPASLALGNPMVELESTAKGRLCFVASVMLRGMTFSVEADAIHHATLRTTLAALAVERWRLAHDGQLPDSLTVLSPDLLPESPTDPFTGEALRYQRRARGFVVYSLGPDRRDDAGKPRPPQAPQGPAAAVENYDISFAVER